MFKIKYSLILLLLVKTISPNAQKIPYYVQSNIVKVVDNNNKLLQNPFAGGLMFPYFASYDLNNDGKQDLVILDRNGQRLLTFINQSDSGKIKYLYFPYYERFFPDTLQQFIEFADYNKDGKMDLFASSSHYWGGIEAYKNMTVGNEIKFNMVSSSIPSLYCGNTTIPEYVYMARTDEPVILDFDKDGDIDIFTGDDLSDSYLVYYKNCSTELYGVPDSFALNEVNDYWGYCMEDYFYKTNLGYTRDFFCHNDSCPPFYPANANKYNLFQNNQNINSPVRHLGMAFLMNDLDGDGDLDVLISDIGFPGLKMLKNGKSELHLSQDSIIDVVKHYPVSKPVNIHSMPGIFFQDIDNDGVKDLIFSPLDVNTSDTPQNLHQIWLYKNLGKNDSVVPQFVQDDFLIDQMIQTGGPTSPAFFDYDADGDQDLFIATKGNYPQTFYKHDRILLYKNIGKKDSNVFKLVDTNYLGLYSLGMVNMSIAFGDIDGDGVKDLIIGSSDGHFRYYHNNASPGQTANFVLANSNLLGNTIHGSYISAAIADINGDSLNDIIATDSGKIFYYQNTGTKLNPSYTLKTDHFCGINLPGNIDYRLSPAIADLNGDGKLDMVLGVNFQPRDIGSINVGTLLFYFGITDNPDSFYQSYDTLIRYLIDGNLQLKCLKSPGTTLRPAIADLDGDGIPDIVVGSDMGGLMFYGTNTSLMTEINSGVSSVLCPGDSIILDAGAGFDSYSWSTGSNTRKITVYSTGNYSCTVTRGGLSYTAYITVTAYLPLKADFSYSQSHLQMNFTTQNSNLDSIYWSFGDGFNSNLLNPSHTYSKADSYQVCMFVKDNCGYTDSKCKRLNFAGINTDTPKPELKIYPNPVSGKFNIQLGNINSAGIYEIRLYDMMGRKIMSGNIEPAKLYSVDVHKFSNGIYQLLLVSNNKIVLQKKLIIDN